MRVSEVVNLKKEDINFNEDLIKIRLSKGKKDRFVRIPDSIKEQLKNYINLNNDEILFSSFRGGKFNPRSCCDIFCFFFSKKEGFLF